MRSRISPEGRRKTTAPAGEGGEEEEQADDVGVVVGVVRPGSADGGVRRARIATARTRPTARLIAKIARQSDTASTAAPKSGPSTEPISWTAETTPSGIPRRSTG